MRREFFNFIIILEQNMDLWLSFEYYIVGSFFDIRKNMLIVNIQLLAKIEKQYIPRIVYSLISEARKLGIKMGVMYTNRIQVFFVIYFYKG